MVSQKLTFAQVLSRYKLALLVLQAEKKLINVDTAESQLVNPTAQQDLLASV